MKTWILVANAAEAKLLTTDNLNIGKLTLIQKFTHPESREKGTDLTTDRPGHYKTGGGAHGSYTENDQKDVEAEYFAIQLAHELKAGWGQNQYKNLLIVTPSHFYGLLKKHFHDSNSFETTHVSKDYTKCTLPELHTHLKEQLFG